MFAVLLTRCLAHSVGANIKHSDEAKSLLLPIYTTADPCISSAVKNPASLAKPGQAALSGFLAKLTGKMRPGKAWQAWPQPSFLGNLGHKSSAFSAMLVPRPDFLGNLGQKKNNNNLAFLATKMLARLSWIFCH